MTCLHLWGDGCERVTARRSGVSLAFSSGVNKKTHDTASLGFIRTSSSLFTPVSHLSGYRLASPLAFPRWLRTRPIEEGNLSVCVCLPACEEETTRHKSTRGLSARTPRLGEQPRYLPHCSPKMVSDAEMKSSEMSPAKPTPGSEHAALAMPCPVEHDICFH